MKKHSWKYYARYAKKVNKKLDYKKTKKARKFKKKYGFDCTETWNLDTETALFLLVRIAYLRDNSPCIPVSYALNYAENAGSEWYKTLSKIIKGLYKYVKTCYADRPVNETKWKKTKELISENFEELWY